MKKLSKLKGKLGSENLVTEEQMYFITGMQNRVTSRYICNDATEGSNNTCDNQRTVRRDYADGTEKETVTVSDEYEC
ncbi:MAG: grasp-with-spasm system A modified peptide [Bacteroidota bacterium]